MDRLAQFLGNPFVIGSIIGGLLIWTGSSCFIGWGAVSRLIRALNRSKETLSQALDSTSFSHAFETISQELAVIPVIGPRWKDFRITLLIPPGTNRPVQATEPAQHWFNQPALTEAVMNQRYHAALPGLLVGVGLLFTFLGLAAALGTAGGIVAEGLSQAQRNDALKTLLDTASFKFLTSLAGLFFSIFYTIFWKAICQRLINCALDDFLLALEERIPTRTASAAQDDIIQLLERQLEQTETFSNTLAVSIGERLDSALDQRLGDHIGPLARAVEQLAAGMATQNQDAVTRMLDEFLGKLNSNAGDSMKQAAERLASVGSDLTSLKDALFEASNRMTQAAEGMSSAMGQGAEQALARITAQFERMVAELHGLSEASRQAGASALTELGNRIGAAAAGFEASAARVAEALGKSASDTGIALGSGAEDAVRRIAAATEGMRTELQAMLAEMRESLGRAGDELRRGGEQGAGALTASLGTAGDSLANVVLTAAQGLRDAGDQAGSALRQGGDAAGSRLDLTAQVLQTAADHGSTALRQGGETAGSRLDQAASAVAGRAAELARETRTLSTTLETLPPRVTDLEQAAGRSVPPLTEAAGDLRAAADAARAAIQPLQDAARTIADAANQITAASRQMTDTQTSGRDMASSMTAAAQRFEGVDRHLAQVVGDLQNGLRGFAQQVRDLVEHTNNDMAKSITSLEGAIRQLEELLDDRWPRTAFVSRNQRIG